ncbi:glycosyltransferase family 2 protein [Sedimentitalea sp. XS_ASV28]|uniref:glycosyltransferase family 2 protein n=1 Tax=Sedimentitalea sp. XS_ASV28 TaxID=3241296 RepID=UPI003515BD4F
MITLQKLTFPEPGICTEHELYFRPRGVLGFSQSAGEIWLNQGGQLLLDSYFNMLNIGKWHAGCTLDGLFAEVTGHGRIELRALQAIPGQSWETLACEVITLAPGVPGRIDLSHYTERSVRGLIYLEIKALEEGGATITGGRFATDTRLAIPPRLAVSITTFRRENEVRRTVARLQEFLAGYEFGGNVHVQVVDNGQSAEIPETGKVTPVDNPNYGGAGGFARGLLEAERGGFTHCLFMDDDASFHMENIARTYAFLALSRDPANAVAGAMINNTHKWAMWENGALFDGSCQPMFCGVDLRNRDAVFQMENDSATLKPPTLYGGWWFFAFAIDRVRHHPFPFFVRGDDISFSLMNDFNITTLNGVVSFQDDFSEKESPQTLYLDLRNHLIHHMVSDKLARSPLGTAKIAIRFIMRSLLRFHYESARAQLLSWQDVMEGPGFFDENIDMAARRATIKEMTGTETWRDLTPEDRMERRKRTLRSRSRRQRLGLWTLNGHLVPFSARRWDRIVLEIGQRGIVFPAFGAARITYLNTAADKGYTVSQSKRQFFAIAWQMTRTLRRFTRDYEALKQQYRDGYDAMTTRGYWQDKLALPPEEPDTFQKPIVSRAKQVSASH